MKKDAQTLTLKVKEALPKDAGRAIARIDPEDMKTLEVEVGEIIEIKGKRKTPAKVMPCYAGDRGKKIIQMDGISRENSQIGLDEKVKICKVGYKPANKIILSPLTVSSLLRKDRDTRYIGSLIEGLPVTAGDRVRATLFGTRSCDFKVEDTIPDGVVLIGPTTLIKTKTKEVGEGKPVKISYEDIGGLDAQIQRIREMIELPLRYPEVFDRLGIDAPKGVFLYGPPGTGKTLIARAVANETDAYFTSISGPQIMGKFYGESEARLRSVFEDAQSNTPAIVFIDEIESIAPKREEMGAEKQVERRVVAQLLSLMDGLESRGQLIVVAATNLPNIVDPALRRPGRFDREISIPIPDKNGRLEILQIHTRGMPLAEDVSLERLAEITHGYVGADIEALAREAAMAALRKILPKIDFEMADIPYETLLKLEVTMDNFLEAMKEVGPSAIREVFVEVPDVKWKDVGGLENIKEELKQAVEWPLKHSDVFKKASTSTVKGILLYGVPGTGKTLLAKAVANESGVNFISVKGPALISKYVGESERAIREVFKKAKQAAPCITGDTVVTLESGKELTAKEIFEKKMLGEKVWSFTSDFKVVPKRIIALQKKSPEQLVEVQTSVGRIRCTPEHKFPVLKDGRLKWIEASALNKGDRVATPRYLRIPDRKVFTLDFMPDNTAIYGGIVDTIYNQLLEKKLDIYEFAQTAGFSRKQAKTCLRTRIQRSRRNINSKFFLTLGELRKAGYSAETISASKMVVHTKGWGQSVSKPVNAPREIDEDIMYVYGLLWSDGSFFRNGQSFRFHGDDIYLHMRLRDIVNNKYGVKESEFVQGKQNLVTYYCSVTLCILFNSVGEYLLELPERLLASWLRGVCDGDGSIPVNASRIAIGATKSNNRELLQKILVRVGIPTVDHKGSNLELTSQSQISTFIEKIGFEHPKRASRAKNYVRQRSHSRLDVIPIGNLLTENHLAAGLTGTELNVPVTTVRYWEHSRSVPSRDRVQVLVNFLRQVDNYQKTNVHLPQMYKLAHSDIFWVPVISVSKLLYKEEVYDLQVEGTQNFMANDMFVHNCIIFFDEIESLVPRRGSASTDAHTTERVISQFLTEMDGIEELKGVVVLAATNRLDLVDPALLRSGRFDLLLELPKPDERTREEIFKIHTKNKPLTKDVGLKNLAKETEDKVGSDIEFICRKASMLGIKEYIENPKDKNGPTIGRKHFEEAVKLIHKQKGAKNA